MDLHGIFDRYIGSEILDPDRITCDWDTVLAPINDAARENSLRLIFQKAGEPVPPQQQNAVRAHIEPLDSYHSLWKITGFTPG